jgi:phosphohistidine phosphatase
MKLLLLRHAIAVPAGASDIADGDRPLTAKGRKRFKKAARGLSQIMPTPDLMLVSPLLRARETAEIAGKAWGLKGTPEPLLAGGDPEALLAAVAAQAKLDVVVLVGHEPDLSQLLAHVTGGGGERMPFKKGGAALVEFDNDEASSGRLIWFMPPRLLRKLGGD